MAVLSRRFLKRLITSSPRNVALAIRGMFRHRRDMRPLHQARTGSALGRLLEARPEIWSMVATPYLCANWTATERFARIVDHCETIERLGPLLDFPLNAFVDLLDLHEIDPTYRLVLDQPHWLLRDGQATFSLWEGRDRLVSLSYCLSSAPGGLTAYVGGLQGRSEEGVLDRYRQFTKQAEGMRPTDFTVALFRAFCRGLGVARILTVSDATHYRQAAYYGRHIDPAPAHLSYDELWRARGARERVDGFFDLPPTEARREFHAITANKRAMYRRRYAMLDAMTARLDKITRDGWAPARIGHYMPAVGVKADNAMQGTGHSAGAYSAETRAAFSAAAYR